MWKISKMYLFGGVIYQKTTSVLVYKSLLSLTLLIIFIKINSPSLEMQLAKIFVSLKQKFCDIYLLVTHAAWGFPLENNSLHIEINTKGQDMKIDRLLRRVEK